MDKEEKMEIDGIITAISVARAHTETALFYAFPYFDRAEADEDVMREIAWEYEHIRVLLEIIQDCMNAIEAQENAWSKMFTQKRNKPDPAHAE